MTSPPTVSVVIPVRNEWTHLGAVLDAVLAQDYEGPIEIVVADGGSTDGTRALLDARAGDDPLIRVIDNPRKTAAAGLNLAIAISSGEIIVRCDGHAEFSADYIRTAVEVLTATGAANVGGVQAAEGERFVQQAIAIAMTSPLGVGNSRFHYSSAAGAIDTVYLGTFDREALEEVGGFDERLLRNQDYELNHRLRAAGKVVWFDPRLRVTYRPRATLGTLWRQQMDYGRWKRTMLRRSPDALKARQLAPPLLVLGLMASVILIAASQPVGLLLPVVYGTFLVLGTIGEGLRRRHVAALLLPVVLAVMHLAWGYGFLFGRARL